MGELAIIRMDKLRQSAKEEWTWHSLHGPLGITGLHRGIKMNK